MLPGHLSLTEEPQSLFPKIPIQLKPETWLKWQKALKIDALVESQPKSKLY